MHKIFLSFVFIAVVAALLISGCAKENEETLFPDIQLDCDSTILTVSFATDILPTIEGQCYACHNNVLQNGGVNLEGYSNIRLRALSGQLVNVLTVDRSSNNAMPPGSSLPQSYSNNLINWIEGCAPEN